MPPSHSSRALGALLLAATCGLASRGAAQAPNVAVREQLALMRIELSARRYAVVIQRGNTLLESPAGPAPEERMQLWQILAAAYFPSEPAAQQPDSATLPLAAMVRLVPDVRLDPAISWPGLDSLLERTRTSQFVVATRPLREYILAPGEPASVEVVATRPARFRLTSVAIATGVAVTHALVDGERAASLRLRARYADTDIFEPGAYRLDIVAIDRETGDSVLTSHWANASLLPSEPEVEAPASRPTAFALPAAASSSRTTTRMVRARSSRTSILLGGLAFAGATVAIATLGRSESAIRTSFATDRRAYYVAAAVLGASVATLRWRSRPPPRGAPAPRSLVSTAPTMPAVPTVTPRAAVTRTTRVLLRLDEEKP